MESASNTALAGPNRALMPPPLPLPALCGPPNSEGTGDILADHERSPDPEESAGDMAAMASEQSDAPEGLCLPRRSSTLGRSNRRGAPSLCTAHCRGSYHVVKDAITRLGYQEVASVTRDASVMWLEHSDPTEGLAPVQTVSRIEAFLPYCRKARLAACLNRWLDELPEEFAFSPKTWLLPEDIAELEKHMCSSEHLKKKKTMIAKPTGGSQGRGIVLARKWRDLEQVAQKSKAAMEIAGSAGGRSPWEFVVQEYLADPILLDGLKFDLRLYLVVTSVVPMRAYLFKEGLARFCTVPYQPPKDDNLSEACMHLTNYAVNKKNKDFETTDSLSQHSEGSKRSVSSVLQALQSLHGMSVDGFWSEVASLAANTLLALRPGLIEYYVHEKPRALHPVGPKGFQIIGLDILIDGNFKPKLLELNANPSLSVTQASPNNNSGNNSSNNNSSSNNNNNNSSSSSMCTTLSGSTSLGKKELSQLAPPESRSISEGESLSTTTTAAPEDMSRTPSNGLPGGSNFGSRLTAGTSSISGSNVVRKNPMRNRSSSMRRPSTDPNSSPEGASRKEPALVSELDFYVKLELVSQALALAKPASRNKTMQAKKKWLEKIPRSVKGAQIPLDDFGNWALAEPRTTQETVRTDNPEASPALEPLDFSSSAADLVQQYSSAHLALYRVWAQCCGANQDTLGQPMLLKLLERSGLVKAEGPFADRTAAQLHLLKEWRELAPGEYGLSLPQFITVAGRLGKRILRDEAASHIQGVITFADSVASSVSATSGGDG